ncbi:phospholipase B1, membrane-associated-like [Condylostylus longicornis]|uniref:phospholipase B1, membrane-associated-like n=1 Tax=Condylostylus longicornis TaxID=2530218 RepID=UPI00244E386D|nr:phospholipase B1, membrane-associated-like [Condylostylus longicornis]
MKIFQLSLLLIAVLSVNSQYSQPQVRGNTAFRRISDQLGRPIYNFFRRWFWIATGSIRDLEEENRKLEITQHALEKIRPEYVDKFFCDIDGPGKRSDAVPTRVHQLRPGDIDIIGAMGDSLSSANGGYSTQPLHLANEFRSIAWSGGGKGTYFTHVTLPNILKMFNPKLYGYSTGDGLTIDKSSKFNLAEPMTMSPDLLFQAKVLINRMRNDGKVDFKNHWKMITIFIGNNDFCSDSCHYESYEKWVDLHEKELIKTLRYLRDHVPRLIVNVVGLPDYTNLFKITNSPIRCYVIYRAGCHCLFQPHMTVEKLGYVKRGVDLWNERDKKISNMEEFHTNDFAAIYQPFMTNVTYFVNEKEGIADLRYMAFDCFHFSQLGHAMAALGLWQNLMEPKSNKSDYWNPNLNKVFKLKCPTEEFPYIRVD